MMQRIAIGGLFIFWGIVLFLAVSPPWIGMLVMVVGLVIAARGLHH